MKDTKILKKELCWNNRVGHSGGFGYSVTTIIESVCAVEVKAISDFPLWRIVQHLITLYGRCDIHISRLPDCILKQNEALVSQHRVNLLRSAIAEILPSIVGWWNLTSVTEVSRSTFLSSGNIFQRYGGNKWVTDSSGRDDMLLPSRLLGSPPICQNETRVIEIIEAVPVAVNVERKTKRKKWKKKKKKAKQKKKGREKRGKRNQVGGGYQEVAARETNPVISFC